MLENHGLTKQGQWAIISEAVDNLKGRYFVTLNKYTRLFNKFFVEKAKEKLESSLKKIPILQIFLRIATCNLGKKQKMRL